MRLQSIKSQDKFSLKNTTNGIHETAVMGTERFMIEID